MKLAKINVPEIPNTHALCRDKVTSHGMNDNADATDAPRPNNTSSEGRAQQKSVLIDVNSDRYPSIAGHFITPAFSVCISIIFSPRWSGIAIRAAMFLSSSQEWFRL